MKLTTTDIEIACAKCFNLRQNIIVPNVSWGMGLHECDLLVLTKSGYAYEVEIKVSIPDLKADLKKRHGHMSKKIKKLYFALPDYLYPECIEHIPERAGVIIVKLERLRSHIRGNRGYKYKIQPVAIIVRDAKITGNYKFTDKERLHLAHLGTMRVWSMKESQRKLLWEKEIENG